MTNTLILIAASFFAGSWLTMKAQEAKRKLRRKWRKLTGKTTKRRH